MTSCHHGVLELLPERQKTMRCRHCHLTIDSKELGEGFCPECYDRYGSRRYEFDELGQAGNTAARYRCEQCGVIIESV